MARILATLLLLGLGSCFMGQAQVDRDLDPQAIAQLQAGRSTSADVLMLMGAPNQVIELANKSAWLYQSQNTKRMGLWLLVYGALGEDTQFDRCWIFFDENHVLTHFGDNLNADSTEYHLSGS